MGLAPMMAARRLLIDHLMGRSVSFWLSLLNGSDAAIPVPTHRDEFVRMFAWFAAGAMSRSDPGSGRRHPE
jgi:hypothetical protein